MKSFFLHLSTSSSVRPASDQSNIKQHDHYPLVIEIPRNILKGGWGGGHPTPQTITQMARLDTRAVPKRGGEGAVAPPLEGVM